MAWFSATEDTTAGPRWNGFRSYILRQNDVSIHSCVSVKAFRVECKSIINNCNCVCTVKDNLFEQLFPLLPLYCFAMICSCLIAKYKGIVHVAFSIKKRVSELECFSCSSHQTYMEHTRSRPIIQLCWFCSQIFFVFTCSAYNSCLLYLTPE